MESKPAPGDAGTDSGTDDDTKLLSAAERELRAHRKRKTGAQKLKQAAPEGASEAAEDMPATKRAHRAVPEPASELLARLLQPSYSCEQGCCKPVQLR